MTRLSAAILAAAMMQAAPSVAAPSDPSYVIRGDTRIGSFRVKADGSLRGAMRAYGRPALRGGGVTCKAVWRSHGLTIHFYNLGGQNACTPRGGRFSQAIMRGDHWRTAAGLRVGMPARTIRRLHPRARRQPGLRNYWPSGWWLVTRVSPFGNGGEYPGLLAETRRGRVSGFRVRYAAGGD
jgi:hypothetical protein